jgi:hypothetical protein
MVNLLWEQHSVAENLALLRSHLDRLDRDLPQQVVLGPVQGHLYVQAAAANSASQQPKNQANRRPVDEERQREDRERGRREEQDRRLRSQEEEGRRHREQVERLLARQAEEDKAAEVRALRLRLRELESMVAVMEPGGGQAVARDGQEGEALERSLALLTAQYEKAGGEATGPEDEVNSVPPAMEPLNNSGRVEESVRLARELRARRDQLERLVQKNIFPPSCNELPGEGGRREGATGRRKETNVSGEPGQQLARLQLQVAKLTGELDRLSGGPPPPPGPAAPAAGCCAAQLHTLSLSLNQVYAALWSLQREVQRVSERQALQQESAGRPESRESLLSSVTRREEGLWSQPAGPEVIWPGLGAGGERQADWTSPSLAPSWPPDHHLSPFPSRDLWNSLAASPGLAPLHPAGLGLFPAGDSGISSAALNNQVSPGVRANNYYDNFRSYSRQNRLSGGPGGGGGPLGPANLRGEGPEGQVNNLPLQSGRPRRKYKINREQNREVGRARGQARQEEGPDPVQLAANTYSSSPGPEPAGPTVDSLTKNIYSQVGNLISAQARAPASLARLLHSLELLGRREEGSSAGQGQRAAALRQQQANLAAQETVETSSFTSEEPESRVTPRRPAGPGRTRSKPAGSAPSFPVPGSNSAFELSSSEQVVEERPWGQAAPLPAWNHSPPQLVRQASG